MIFDVEIAKENARILIERERQLDALSENLKTAKRDGLPTATMEQLWVEITEDDPTVDHMPTIEDNY
jgi:hypothetical protein